MPVVPPELFSLAVLRVRQPPPWYMHTTFNLNPLWLLRTCPLNLPYEL
jgi:hypothetical protein